MNQHHHFMHMALAMAAQQAGQTWPNPFVGAVIVRSDQVIAKAATAASGRPHAETQALQAAGEHARGATMYVTLEPCAHDGATPPCVDAVLQAGIARLVVACPDPDPRTAGKSLQKLRAGGVEVIEGILADQARWQHRGFFTRLAHGRPWVTLKMASSMDGRVALSSGESRWITGELARGHGHLLRAQYDAILSTSRSVMADDARLTCRLPGLAHRTPLRMVIDRHLLLTPESSVLTDAASPVWIITYADPAAAALTLPGHAELIPLKSSKNWLEDLLNMFAQRGLTRVLLECGGTFASAMLGAGLVDEIHWLRAPVFIGDDGIASIQALGIETLADLHHWHRRESRLLGPDELTILTKARH